MRASRYINSVVSDACVDVIQLYSNNLQELPEVVVSPKNSLLSDWKKVSHITATFFKFLRFRETTFLWVVPWKKKVCKYVECINIFHKCSGLISLLRELKLALKYLKLWEIPVQEKAFYNC